VHLDPPQRSRGAAPTERLALLIVFGALLAVLAILGTTRTAHAAEGPASPEPGLQLAEEDWELGEEECLEAESEEEIEVACEEEDETRLTRRQEPQEARGGSGDGRGGARRPGGRGRA